jgi:peptidyl-prolyl cis-trans isomerase B (cyclophilin B)
MKLFKNVMAICCLLVFTSCGGDGFKYVQVETSVGTMKFKLYNSTPKHRDNFVKLASEGYYDGLLFHRIIPGFMAQGGDPDSKGAPAGQRLGSGGPGYRVDAEIGAPHFKGTLAAARDGNPEKASSGSQFYIVQGRPVSDGQITQSENRWKIQYSEEQKAKYKKIGGTIQLDMDYTVFGEIVEGMDVIDKLCGVQTAPGDRPLEDMPMTVKVVR